MLPSMPLRGALSGVNDTEGDLNITQRPLCCLNTADNLIFNLDNVMENVRENVTYF